MGRAGLDKGFDKGLRQRTSTEGSTRRPRREGFDKKLRPGDSAVGDRAGAARRNSGWQWRGFGYSRGQLDSTCSDCLCQGHCKQINTHSAIYEYYYDYDHDYEYYDKYYDDYHYYDYYDHNYYYYFYYY